MSPCAKRRCTHFGKFITTHHICTHIHTHAHTFTHIHPHAHTYTHITGECMTSHRLGHANYTYHHRKCIVFADLQVHCYRTCTMLHGAMKFQECLIIKFSTRVRTREHIIVNAAQLRSTVQTHILAYHCAED